MTCCGKVVFFVCFICSIAAVCSFFFPIMRASDDDYPRVIYQYYGEEKIPLSRVLDLLGTNPSQENFSSSSSAELSSETGAANTTMLHAFVRTNLWNTNCKPARIMFITSSITATVGTAFAGIAVITLSALCCKIKQRKVTRIACVAGFFSPVAFLLLAVSLVLMVVMYTNDVCNDGVFFFQALRLSGYSLVEGFILLCIAAGGMFLVSLMQCCL